MAIYLPDFYAYYNESYVGLLETFRLISKLPTIPPKIVLYPTQPGNSVWCLPEHGKLSSIAADTNTNKLILSKMQYSRSPRIPFKVNRNPRNESLFKPQPLHNTENYFHRNATRHEHKISISNQTATRSEYGEKKHRNVTRLEHDRIISVDTLPDINLKIPF